jgi:hypothetical protein
MSKPFKTRLLIWLWGAFAATIGGVISGLGQAVGIAAVNGVLPGAIQPLTLNQFYAACVSGGLTGLYLYNQTPKGKLPSLDEGDDDATP